MLPGTQVSSRARTKALFDEEQRFIAPGLQTIALLSELAIERGRGATLTDVDGNTYLDLNAGRLGGEPRPRAPALRGGGHGAARGGVASAASPRAPRAELVRLIAELAPGDLKRVAVLQRRRRSGRSGHSAGPLVHRSGPTSSVSPAPFTARPPACCRCRTSTGRTAVGPLPRATISRLTPIRRDSTARQTECLSSIHRVASARHRARRPAARPPRSSSSPSRARPATSCRRRGSSGESTRSRASSARS